MAHVAKLNTEVIKDANLGDTYLVEQVIVVADEEENPCDFCQKLLGDGKYIQTSYTSSIRNTFAFPGAYYIENMDIFIQPKPYNSWIFDKLTLKWIAPVEYPKTGMWNWDEETLLWKEATIKMK